MSFRALLDDPFPQNMLEGVRAVRRQARAGVVLVGLQVQGHTPPRLGVEARQLAFEIPPERRKKVSGTNCAGRGKKVSGGGKRCQAGEKGVRNQLRWAGNAGKRCQEPIALGWKRARRPCSRRSGHAALHWKTTVLEPSALVLMVETARRDPLLAQYASAVRDAYSSS